MSPSLLALFALPTTSQFLTAIALKSTHPKSSFWRLTTAATVVYLTFRLDRGLRANSGAKISPPQANACLTYTWFLCARDIVDLCIDPLSFLTFRDALLNTVNERAIGTPAQISRLPEVKKESSQSKTLLRYLRNFCLGYILLDLLTCEKLRPPPDPAFLANRSFLAIGSVAEFFFRLSLSIGPWVTAACFLITFQSLVMLVLLPLDLWSIDRAPPVFGRLADAYTVRGYWGHAYHQYFRRVLTSSAEFVVHKLLRLPENKSSLLARYAKIGVAFFLSGLIHYQSEYALVQHESRALHFFSGTVVWIMVEDGLQHVFRKVDGIRWKRFLGYIWVCCYLYTMTPMWITPQIRGSKPGDQMVPFSVVGYLLDSKQ